MSDASASRPETDLELPPVETDDTSRQDGSSGSLLAIFAVVFVDLLGFGLVLPLLARYGKYFETGDSGGWLLGSLVASFSAMQFLFSPAWGRLSDRVGRRPVLLVGLVGSVLFYGLFGYASQLPREKLLLGLTPFAWLFVSRIGAGICGATISTAQAYIADVTTVSGRSRGMALIGVAFGMGFIFGPLLGVASVGSGADNPPSAAPGYLASGLSGIAFLLAWFWLQEPQRNRERRHMAANTRASLLRDSLRLAIMVELFVAVTAFAAFESTLALLSEDLGFAERSNYLLFAYVGVVLVLAQGLLVRRLAPRLREIRLLLIGLTTMVVGLIVLALVAETSRRGYLLYGGLGLAVVGFSFLNPALQALLSLSTSAEQQGAVLGLGQSFSALARIVGPVAGITLYAWLPAGCYAIAACAMLLATGLVFPISQALQAGRARQEPDFAHEQAPEVRSVAVSGSGPESAL